MSIRTTRREAVAGAAALAAAAAAGDVEAGAAARPNVLFIMADDMGWADLSCYGQRDFTTPVLDRLAADGLQLSDCYASSCVCSATRVALATGRYQHRLQVGLSEPVRGDEAWLPEDHPTIATVFKGIGYRTSLIGKWHLSRSPERPPNLYGYDYSLTFNGGGSDYFLHSGPGKPPANGLFENGRPLDRPGYLTDIFTDTAVARVEEAARARTPFFISLHYNAPHWPWEGPGDEAEARAMLARSRPGEQYTRHYDGGSLAKYAEMVRHMDSGIGKVLAAIRARGLERDTIVVFTSDNGGERFSDTWPFIGMKGELLEGGVRVPGIVRWPARIRRGSRSKQVVTSMDWLPTLAGAAGAAPAPSHPSDGLDLSGVLTGREPVRPRKVYWRYYANSQGAVRDGDWKYLKIDNREHLFDLAADQRERANLKDREPAVFARLKADYAAWAATMLPYPANWLSESPRNGSHADR